MVADRDDSVKGCSAMVAVGQVSDQQVSILVLSDLGHGCDDSMPAILFRIKSDKVSGFRVIVHDHFSLHPMRLGSWLSHELYGRNEPRKSC